MSGAALEDVLRRDRLIVVSALATVTALAWAYVLWLAAMPMAGAPTPGMSGMAAPAFRAWTPAEFAFMFVMWSVMMVGMMTPSAVPMVLTYALAGRREAERGRPFAATGWFASGYLLAWTAFSFVATSAQWVLERAALVTPMMVGTSAVFGGIVLITTALYQWTPLKSSCLAQCQAPPVFIQQHGGFRRDALGSLRLGLVHGGYCIGCCWALMALLFVGGVMNVLWIAGIAAVVLLEKVAPMGGWMERGIGAICLGAGAWLLGSALSAWG